MSVTMIRVSKRTRDVIMKIAEHDYGGVTADEALWRLTREHWRRRTIAAVDSYREQDPDGWADYLSDGTDLDQLSAPVTDTWDGE